MAEGGDYCAMVKTSHNGFYLATLENFMEYWPGRSYLVMNSTQIFPGGTPLMTVGYKYNTRKFLGFIATEGGGSTEPVNPSLFHLSDIYSNVYFGPVVCPQFMVRHFNSYNAIDNHNRMWQYEIALEKYWVTQSEIFFTCNSSSIGMGITKRKLVFWHGISEGNVDKKFLTRKYKTGRFMIASIIPFQLILIA